MSQDADNMSSGQHDYSGFERRDRRDEYNRLWQKVDKMAEDLASIRSMLNERCERSHNRFNENIDTVSRAIITLREQQERQHRAMDHRVDSLEHSRTKFYGTIAGVGLASGLLSASLSWLAAILKFGPK